jgi:hypothetical protein
VGQIIGGEGTANEHRGRSLLGDLPKFFFVQGAHLA